MEVEWMGEDKEELWWRQGEDSWLDFPGGRERKDCVRGGCKRLANAARVHVEDIRGIVLSTPPTHPLLFFSPRFLHGWRCDGDEANQGIMEELHTCAASPMLYYINREYSRTSTYPFSLYNRRARVRRGARGRMNVGCKQERTFAHPSWNA